MLRAILFSCTLFVTTLSLRAMEDHHINNFGPEIFISSQGSASLKLNTLWDAIEDSSYENLPPIKGPGLGDLGNLMSVDYLKQVFFHDEETMIKGREKLIHGSGTCIKVALVPDCKANHPFTGFLSNGSEHALLRLSLAKPPENGQWTYGFAIKFLRQSHTSENIFAMFGLQGQPEANPFAQEFSTALPEPGFDIKLRILASRFNAAVEELGQGPANARALSLRSFSQGTELGLMVGRSHAPYKLTFKPTKAARDLFRDLRNNVDFRAVLEGQGNKITLYEVYAHAFDSSPGERIGFIETRSNFMASFAGDERINFKHSMPHSLPDSSCPFSSWF